MTRSRLLAVLAAAGAGAIVVPGLFFIGMRAGVRARTVKTGVMHPVLSIPRARLGGIVREVLVKAGDRVEAGQVLVRLEAKEWEERRNQLRQAAHAAEAAARGGEALAQIPNQLRQYLYEMHPETAKAESEYVDALAALEKAQGGDREAANVRLRHAIEERTLVRRRLSKLFSGSANGEDARVYQAEIARNLAEVEKLFDEAEVRAPSRAIVDLLEAHAGDRILPGQPVAVLIAGGEYSVDLAVTPAEASRLHAGMALNGRLREDNRKLVGRIESISVRKLPVIARDNLQTAEEPVVRVRMVLTDKLRAGLRAEFELP